MMGDVVADTHERMTVVAHLLRPDAPSCPGVWALHAR